MSFGENSQGQARKTTVLHASRRARQQFRRIPCLAETLFARSQSFGQANRLTVNCCPLIIELRRILAQKSMSFGPDPGFEVSGLEFLGNPLFLIAQNSSSNYDSGQLQNQLQDSESPAVPPERNHGEGWSRWLASSGC